MKRDIHIPKVRDVFVAAVREKIEDTNSYEWGVYIINNQKEGLELVIVVSEGFSKDHKTSTLRKTVQHLPKQSYAKLEILPEELFKLTNTYKVSFFKDNQLFDKTFIFDKNVIKDSGLQDLPLIANQGILAK